MPEFNKIDRRKLGDEEPRVKDIVLVIAFFLILILVFWFGHIVWNW